MPLTASEVRVGITGQLYTAPLGSTAPTDATTALVAAFVGLGYVSEDGVTEAHDDSVENITAWQNAVVVRSAVSSSASTLACMLIQSNVNVLTRFHRGSAMTEVAAGNYRLDVKPIVADPRMWVFDVVDGTKLERILVGLGEITERGELQYANGQPLGYPIKITAYPDGNGNLMQKWSNDAAWDPTP